MFTNANCAMSLPQVLPDDSEHCAGFEYIQDLRLNNDSDNSVSIDTNNNDSIRVTKLNNPSTPYLCSHPKFTNHVRSTW